MLVTNRLCIMLLLFFAIIPLSCSQKEQEEVAPNILFVVFDDLRPQLGCYGQNQMHTPHLDKFSERAVLFERAYCQQAICGPSRSSFLTGIRPENLGIYNNSQHFRTDHPDLITLPQFFKQHGYQTASLGKIFHNRDPQSWSVPEWVPPAAIAHPIYGNEQNLRRQQELKESGGGVPRDSTWWAEGYWTPVVSIEQSVAPDSILFDGQVARESAKRLRNMDQSKPFFLAVGFFLPHIPYIAPSSYYELYPVESISMPKEKMLPEGAPLIAGHDSPSIWKYEDIQTNRKLTDSLVQALTQGYYASTSYADAQFGRVMQALKESDLLDNTIVVVFGDHGYHHGDYGMWGKMTNFEYGTRVPLMISVPDSRQKGVRSQALAELVDVYPTLCELAGLPIPENLDGISLNSVLRDPATSVRQIARSRYPRGSAMGWSMRTDRYRYTRWENESGTVLGEELYDYALGPIQQRNLIADPAYDSVATQVREDTNLGG